ncbi:MAG: hypothetical protein ACJA05_000696 [Porticoccus sp.]|jgi:hypothetical protein
MKRLADLAVVTSICHSNFIFLTWRLASLVSEYEKK